MFEMNWVPLGLDDVIGASVVIGLATYVAVRFVGMLAVGRDFWGERPDA